MNKKALEDQMIMAKEIAWSRKNKNHTLFTVLTLVSIVAGALTLGSSGAVIAGIMGVNSLPIVAGLAGMASFAASGVLSLFGFKESAIQAARAAAELEKIIRLLDDGKLDVQTANQEFIDIINKYPDFLGDPKLLGPKG